MAGAQGEERWQERRAKKDGRSAGLLPYYYLNPQEIYMVATICCVTAVRPSYPMARKKDGRSAGLLPYKTESQD
jgi:hypothetical protein